MEPPTTAQTDQSPSFRYDAFISYRHVEPDRKWAKWLHGALETYRVPKELVAKGLPKRLTRVFRDEEELPANADLSKEITTALDQSKFLIVICSPRAPQSRWVNAEVEHFRRLGRHDRILALLIEGEPCDAFPPALTAIRRNITDAATGQTREEIEEVEPLAADVRPERSDVKAHTLRSHARLRLLACILGCRFDDLRQREAERRAARLRAVGAGLALLVLVMAGLTSFAFLERTRAIAGEAEAELQTGIARKNADDALKQKREADAQRQTALTQQAIAESANNFLNDQLLGAIDPGTAQGREVTVREVVQRAIVELQEHPPAESAVEQRLRLTLGTLLQKLGNDAGGRSQLRQSLQLAERLYGSESAAVVNVLDRLGSRGMRTVVPPPHGREPVESLERAIRIMGAMPQSDPSLLARLQTDLSIAREIVQGEATIEIDALKLGAIALARGKGESIEQVRAFLKDCLSRTAAAASSGDMDGAIRIVREASMPMQNNPMLRDSVPLALSWWAGQAALRLNSPAAEPTARAALEIANELYHGDHPTIATCTSNLATVMRLLGRESEALPLFQSALAVFQRIYKGEHVYVAMSLSNVAASFRAVGQPEKALPMHESALAMLQKLHKVDHPDTATCIVQLAECLESLDRPEEALVVYQTGLDMSRRLAKGDHRDLAMFMNSTALCLDRLSRYEEALPLHQAAFEMAQRLFPGDHTEVAIDLGNLGSCLDALGRPGEALPNHEEALRMLRRMKPDNNPDVQDALSELADCLLALGRIDLALSTWQECLTLRCALLKPDDWRIAATRIGIGRALMAQSKFAAAESIMLDGLSALSKSSDSGRKSKKAVRSCYEGLASLYAAWDKAESGKGFDVKAIEWREKLAAAEKAATLDAPKGEK